jgi:peptidyl-prolyl cis-trans isomerase A (cyclophilin A)
VQARFFGKSAAVLILYATLLGIVGCQKGGDSAPPSTAVAGSTGEKAALVAARTESAEARSEREQHPTFAIDTNAGKIVVRLDAEKAPLTVDNFRSYVARGHYDSTIFHQVVKTPVAILVGGIYTAELKEKTPRTPILNEADNGLKNRRGTIAMLRRADDQDSATCQFFFNLADNDILNYKCPSPKDSDSNILNYKARSAKDYGYCVFGEVTEGLEILDQIAMAPVHDSGKFVGLPVKPVAIKAIRQIR